MQVEAGTAQTGLQLFRLRILISFELTHDL
jgi:hypothetical protein